jgi:glycine cleavage system H protein
MVFPPDLLYSRDHLWLRKDDELKVTLGITDFAQDQLGRVVFVDLPQVGQRVAVGQEMGAVESAKSVSDLLCPVSGQVEAVNELPAETPTLLNDDPYGQGWLVVIKLDQPLASDLMSAEQYRVKVE